MSLTDLKKSNNKPTIKKKFTIDEFISDAEDYAKGKPKIVSGLINIELQQGGKVTQHIKQRDDKPFRRATFTLSEAAINQLQDLSLGSGLAKSHILRILIDGWCNKEQSEQLQKLLQSSID